jgi:hypothetical protein
VNEALFELVFMLVILKLPVVYLCLVVWWAVKAVPEPLEGSRLPARPGPGGDPWRRRPPRRPRPGPHGAPVRSYARRPAPRRVTVEP